MLVGMATASVDILAVEGSLVVEDILVAVDKLDLGILPTVGMSTPARAQWW